MKMRLTPVAVAIVLLASDAIRAQPLYAENFDVDNSSNWLTNNNGNGTNAANFFFDYSSVGIPSAPNSTGGTTIGMKLQANISGTGPASGVLPGISVSPKFQNFGGDYQVRFDWWHNWLGSATTGLSSSSGGSGSTQLSTFGVLSSGTTANFAGSADCVFFAATGDGASAADFRTYSPERPTGYTVGQANNTYAAGSTNSSAALFQTLFPAGATAPAAQTAISPTTQGGATLAGTAGFRWHDVVIEKTGNIITWTINGTLIATVDTTNIVQPMGGTNIIFGMADTSLGAGTPANLFQQLDFTLIDNVRVIPEPGLLSAVGLAALVLFRRRST